MHHLSLPVRISPASPLRAIIVRSLLLGVLLIPGIRSGSQANDEIQGPVSVPSSVLLPCTLQLFDWQGIPTAIGTINKNQALERFVLDTGLNACTISGQVYTKFVVQGLPTHKRLDIFNASTVGQEAELGELKIAAVRLTKVPVIVVDAFALVSHAPRSDAPACWLGTPFLAAFMATFDMSNHLLVLQSKSAVEPEAPNRIVVPLSMRSGRPYVKLTVPGVGTLTAQVDTGAPASVFPASVGVKLKLKPLDIVTARGENGKEVKIAIAKIPSISVGKATVHDLQAAVATQTTTGTPDTTILGSDFLSRFRATFDFSRQKLILIPNESAPAAPTQPQAVPTVPPVRLGRAQ
jgi:predicted aspartyl protease